ncbi:carboxypeptidase-like regulatory domain-containing protein [Fimbriiglobus ruber]|uniref:Uncharacterized protein n=1 Tax=Fimbriiglobus ruber TaxID=1908690 RepID=A0A225DY10_9BACT|nr:carboxypeptidase-like regulatory domain-containing protein [Fimbriiglobus ruber]OWK45823.1 hypothetical protein FRUB_02154 [Fimbriiglobus ruber]
MNGWLRLVLLGTAGALAGGGPAAAAGRVDGHIRWTHRNGTKYAVTGAAVDIQNADTKQSVATATTDRDGKYRADFPVPPGGVRVLVRVDCVCPGAKIAPAPGKPAHFLTSRTPVDVADDTVATVDLTATNTRDNHTAFSVREALHHASTYAGRLGKASLPPVRVYYPSTDTQYDPALNQLEFLQSDRWDWDVIFHEYGHYLAKKYDLTDCVTGDHQLGQNLADSLGKKKGTRMAWSEGWPTFFSVSAQRAMNLAALGIPYVGDTRYTDTEESYIYDVDLTLRDGYSTGEDNETSVQRAFFCLYHEFRLADDAIWAALVDATPKTLSDAWAAVAKGRKEPDLARLGQIFTDFRIASAPTDPADGVKLPPHPPTFKWTPNGGKGDYSHDRFNVVFIDAQCQPVLTSNQLTTPEYKPTTAEWTTITAGRTDVLWYVLSANSKNPSTGPYRSGWRKLAR